MKTTIDKAGRIVIPARVREKAGFSPGTEIEVITDDVCVKLVRAVRGPVLGHRGKLLVARATTSTKRAPAPDIARMIDEERNRWPG